MNEYTSSTYGDRIASVYDDFYGPADVPQRVDVLTELAAGGRALELGIGTGTYALPLAARDVDVHGIDSSRAMADQLRAKEGGEALPVTIGDFADVDVEGTFSLVFVVSNTLASGRGGPTGAARLSRRRVGRTCPSMRGTTLDTEEKSEGAERPFQTARPLWSGMRMPTLPRRSPRPETPCRSRCCLRSGTASRSLRSACRARIHTRWTSQGQTSDIPSAPMS